MEQKLQERKWRVSVVYTHGLARGWYAYDPMHAAQGEVLVKNTVFEFEDSMFISKYFAICIFYRFLY